MALYRFNDRWLRTCSPLLNKYLTSFPEDVEMRTLRIGLWQTSGLKGKIRKDIVATDFSGLEGSPFARMQYFRLATAYGDGAKSLPFAYRLLLENWNGVDCHSGYPRWDQADKILSAMSAAPYPNLAEHLQSWKRWNSLGST